jgi:hypothetical protein
LLYQGAENLATTPGFNPPGFEGQRQPGSFNLPAMALRGLARRVGFTGPGEGRPSGWLGMPPETQARLDALGASEEWGTIPYRMAMAEGREDRQFFWNMPPIQYDEQGNMIPWDEATLENLEKQRARHVAMSLMRGDYPQVILESDRIHMGFSTSDMEGQGYVWDAEKEHWIYAGVTEGPEVAGATKTYGGGGGGYAGYPRTGGGGGGYGYPVFGAGGGVEINFPEGTQSFVRRGQRGVTPQQRRNQAARFGAVSWRI